MLVAALFVPKKNLAAKHGQKIVRTLKSTCFS